MSTLTLKRIPFITVIFLTITFVGYFGYQVHRLSAAQKVIKQDYSIANNISFGVLSINKWRDLLIKALSHRIENFEFSPPEKDSLQKAVEGILNGLVDKIDSLMNAPKKSIGGKLKKLAFHAFINEDDLRRQVPSFSRKIIQELMRPRNKYKIAYLAKSKLQDLGEDTYDSSRQEESTKVDSIYKKYNAQNAGSFESKTSNLLKIIGHDTQFYAFGMLLGIVLILTIWFLVRKARQVFVPLYILSILAALIVLFTGLTSTMIEIDARINALNFQLIGESISFKNQVLFFQSKSIVDVVSILVHTGQADSILVGILILTFSIIFPIAKLLSAGIYLLGQNKWSKSRVINYFAFYSGKWSMADVTVIAIFMAYLGFNGILDDQMSSLNIHSAGFTSIATNHTSLQPGYMVFICFVLFSLVLSQLLKHIVRQHKSVAN